MRIIWIVSKYIQYHIDFGYTTPLWDCQYWFSIIKVYLDGEFQEVDYAEVKFKLFKHYRYWFK